MNPHSAIPHPAEALVLARIPATTRARLERCADPEQLRHWLRRAATLDDVADLFAASLGRGRDAGKE